MFTIKRADFEEAQIIHSLAHKIYFSTYEGILSNAQMTFMLEKNYTIEALQSSMKEGQDFFLIIDNNDVSLGFIAFKSITDTILRVEKLYLLPDKQGYGLGRLLIEFAEKKAKEEGFTILELNVNRGNSAFIFYLKLGFTITQEVDIPYYGYVLDDYVMQKKVN